MLKSPLGKDVFWKRYTGCRVGWEIRDASQRGLEHGKAVVLSRVILVVLLSLFIRDCESPGIVCKLPSLRSIAGKR